MKSKMQMCIILAILVVLTATGCAARQAGSVDEALDQAVSDAILSHNKDSFLGGGQQMFATEYHEILKTVVQDQTVEVYVAALYAQYRFEGGEVELTGAGSGPCAISFAVTDDAYSVTEYWVPEDGEDYTDSIRSRFPKDVWEGGTDMSAPDAMEICNQRAKDYFEARENCLRASKR